MKLKIDRESNAAYLSLIKKRAPGCAACTVTVHDRHLNSYDIALDFDAKGKLIGIEILDLRLLPKELLK
jgi:uncharacterized protein YuzE